MTQNEKKHIGLCLFSVENPGAQKKNSKGKVRPLLIFPRIKYDSIFFLDFFSECYFNIPRIFYPPSSFVLVLLFVCFCVVLFLFFKSVCPCHNIRPAVVVTALAGGKSLAVVVAWRLLVPIGCNVSTCWAQWVRDHQLWVRRNDRPRGRCWNAVAAAPTS